MALNLRKDGSSTLTLSGDNTNAAVDFEIAEGALALGSANAISIDSLASTSEVFFTGGELRFTSTNTADYSARFPDVAGQVYRINTNGHDVTFASPLQSTGGSLTKLGSGTLTLTSATNSYDGATSVQGGVLQIDGNLSDVTGVDVASSATYVANSSDTIGSISGDGVIDIALGETLNVGGTSDFSFDGSFIGGWRAA